MGLWKVPGTSHSCFYTERALQSSYRLYETSIQRGLCKAPRGFLRPPLREGHLINFTFMTWEFEKKIGTFLISKQCTLLLICRLHYGELCEIIRGLASWSPSDALWSPQGLHSMGLFHFPVWMLLSTVHGLVKEYLHSILIAHINNLYTNSITKILLNTRYVFPPKAEWKLTLQAITGFSHQNMMVLAMTGFSQHNVALPTMTGFFLTKCEAGTQFSINFFIGNCI